MEALIGVLGGLLGVLLGWWLTRETARDAAREERDWQERQTVRQRQEIAAEGLREAVIEVQGLVPRGVKSANEVRDESLRAHDRLRKGWTRASLLTDEGIDRCYYAADMTLFIASQEIGEADVNFWPVDASLVELRRALDAYLLREDLPDPHYPTSSELIQIAHQRPSGSRGLEAINEHIIEHGIGIPT